MKQWLISHKSEIIVGVIVTIVTTMLLNLGGIIANILPDASSSVVILLRNSIYYTASKQGVTSTQITIMILMLSLLMVPVFFGLVAAYKDSNTYEMFTAVKEELQKQGTAEIKKSDKDSVIDMLNSEINHLAKKRNKKFRKGKIVLCFIYFVFFFVYMWCYIITPANMWQVFENRVIQISPYIKESEEKMIRSKWVSMRSKEDYDVIEELIGKVVSENNLP